MKKIILLLLSLVFLLGMESSAYASVPKRLTGNNQYETAVAIAQDGWEQSDYAVLANGETYPDALCAAPLAQKYNAPILLTTFNDLPSVTKKELAALKVQYVFIVGGTGVISEAIESELQTMGVKTIRLSGHDQYDTAVQIARELPSPHEIFVVTGEDYPDALSVAPIASIAQAPILFVPSDYLPESIKKFISENTINKTYIIGDKDLINDNVVGQFPGGERIIGSDKYVRNVNINNKFKQLISAKCIYVARGEGFADALAGGPLAAKLKGPILLVDPNSDELPSSIVAYLHRLRADRVQPQLTSLGGTAAVPDILMQKISNFLKEQSSGSISKSDLISGVIQRIDANSTVVNISLSTPSTYIGATQYQVCIKNCAVSSVVPIGTDTTVNQQVSSGSTVQVKFTNAKGDQIGSITNVLLKATTTTLQTDVVSCTLKSTDDNSSVITINLRNPSVYRGATRCQVYVNGLESFIMPIGFPMTISQELNSGDIVLVTFYNDKTAIVGPVNVPFKLVKNK
ncbi:cell wall-binding repeat-containing protein [Desulfosporosinus sp. SYSU MS00001]|uniref:cell wall-binding repeat-containing protein n=1 Tax=Desulfosporosinus sp. SYSU MS00001 TaxID=3416284 RepID=UPI003CE75939